jgi:hypothetical protein
MRFADVDGKKVSVIFVVVVERSDVADLATEGRSGKAAEDQDERFLASTLANMKTFIAVERDQSGVRGVVADFQVSAMHVRQGVTHHAVGVLRASGHERQAHKRGDEQRQDGTDSDFPKESHWLRSPKSYINTFA